MKVIPSCPSVARLTSIGVDNPEQVHHRIKQGFEIGNGHISHSVADFLEEINSLSGHFGVESLYPERPEIWYLNAGDTYTTTLCYNHDSDRFFIACWGDLV